MKPKIYNWIVLFLALSVTAAAAGTETDSEFNKERQVKAAFIYNFLKFIDWPKEKMQDGNEPIIIGIIGDKDFVKHFDPVKDKQIKNRKITVQYIDGFQKTKESPKKTDSLWNQKIEALKKCHIVLFCTCDTGEIENPARIIKALEGPSVLTVGETAEFLEAGGIINLLVEDKKVCFEVNLDASDKAGFNVNSNLLRLAKKVFRASKSDDDKNK